MNAEHWRKFIDSLDGEHGLPEEMHGWRFDYQDLSETNIMWMSKNDLQRFTWYLIERCRRAESRQIPGLKERVKEIGRDAMDAAISYDCNYPWKTPDYEAFRALCTPEKQEES